MKLYFPILVFLLIAFSSVSGQTLARRAEIAYQEENYKVAAESYEKFKEKKGRLLPEMFPNLANSYYYLNEYDKAEEVFKKTRRGLMDASMYYNYAEMLRRMGRYTEAMSKYRTGMSRRPTAVIKKCLNLGVTSCQWAMDNQGQMQAATVRAYESNLPVAVQSLGMSFYKKGLVYSYYNKEAKKIAEDGSGMPILDLYYFPEGDTAAVPSLLLSEKQAKHHVGSPVFSADLKTVYYTRLVKSQGRNVLKIYSAQSDDSGEWGKEELMFFCSDDYDCAHPALSLDGNTLYFSSNMKGTKGGMDIFSVTKRGEKWSKPKNMGTLINTAATEVFPYITPEGDLTFSSNGHPGFGGLDVFWVRKEKGKLTVYNAYEPINSSFDDFAAVIRPENNRKGYFSSNRADGKNDVFYTLSLANEFEQEIAGEEVNVDSLNALFGFMDQEMLALHDTATSVSTLADNTENIELHKSQEESVVELVDPEDAMDAERQEDVKVSQDEEYVNLNPIFLFDLGLDGVLTTYLADALSLKPLANSHFTLLSKFNNEVLLSGNADEIGIVTLDFRETQIKVNQPLLMKAQTEGGEYNTFSLELVSDELRAYDYANPILLTPEMQKRERVKESIVVSEESIGEPAFAFGRAELTAAGEQYMDSWAEFLLKNPDVSIKLKTHTDTRGGVAYNFKLSQQRAYFAKRYLIDKGVNHLQVIARGYGERYPISKCVRCTEVDHSMNRRIEVEVLNIK